MTKLNDLIKLLCVAITLTSHAQKAPEPKIPFLLASNTEPYRSNFIWFQNAETALTLDKSKSTFRQSLNGSWKFKWVSHPSKSPSDFFSPSVSTDTWDQLPVPANWSIVAALEKRPYDKPIPVGEVPALSSGSHNPGDEINPTGLYRTTFTIPEHWNGKTILLKFGGVQSGCHVWVNGKPLGYHDDSMTPFEFQINNYLQTGINHLAVQVVSRTATSDLESSKHWKLSGIFRDVTLLAAPEVHVSDFNVTTTVSDLENGTLKLEAYVKNFANTSRYGYTLSATLYDTDKQPVASVANQTLEMLESQKEHSLRLLLEIAKPKSWTSETPNLYHLVIQLLDPNKKVTEAIAQKVGFRNIKINKGKLMVNGKAITIKGVNRGEFDPVSGYAVSREVMVRDIELMKQHHINAVRTVPYSTDPEWYNLCDEYGLYVFDAANIDGLPSKTKSQNIADDPEWKPVYLSRAKAMVSQNKNHPAVIAWSLGDESEIGQNFQAMADYIRLADPTRPIHFAGDRSVKFNASHPFDMISAGVYTSAKLLQTASAKATTPVVLSKFANTTGNAGGGLKDFWDALKPQQKIVGGFLWNWADQGLLLSASDGQAYRYDGNTTDSLREDDGLVNPDRRPQPEIQEVKRVFQYITSGPLTPEPGKGGRIALTNAYDFTSLAAFELVWELQEDGKTIQSGKIDKLSAPERQTEHLLIPYRLPNVPTLTGRYYLNVSIRQKKAVRWAPADFEVAWFQYEIPSEKISPTNIIFTGVPPLRQTIISGTGLSIKGQHFSVIFDKNTGTMSSFQYKGKALFERGLYPDFWRIPTSPDRSGKKHVPASPERNTAIQALELGGTDLRSEKLSPHIYKVTLISNLKAKQGTMLVKSVYTVYATGDIHLHHTLTPSRDWPSITKIGFQGRLAPDLNQVAWFGMGPNETYADRKESGRIGWFEGKVSEQHFPFISPQESGNKTEVKWVTITDPEGTGLLAISDSVFNVNVHDYTSQSLMASRKQSESATKEEAKVLNLDMIETGLAPDDRTESNISPTQYEYSFRMRGIDSTTTIPGVLASTMHILAPLSGVGDTIDPENSALSASPPVRKYVKKKKHPVRRRRK